MTRNIEMVVLIRAIMGQGYYAWPEGSDIIIRDQDWSLQFRVYGSKILCIDEGIDLADPTLDEPAIKEILIKTLSHCRSHGCENCPLRIIRV